MTFLCAGSLSFSLLLVAGLLGILVYFGMGYFWPSPLELFETKSGETFLAEQQGRRVSRGSMIANSGDTRAEEQHELYLKVGSRDVFPIDFRWVAESDIVKKSRPKDVAVFERYEHGVFYGRIKDVRRGDKLLAEGHEASLAKLGELMPIKALARDEVHYIEKIEAGDHAYYVNGLQEKLQCLERSSLSKEERSAKAKPLQEELETLSGEYARIEARLLDKRKALEEETVTLELVDGRTLTEPASEIFWVYEPNKMGLLDQLQHFFAKIWEFLSDDPREANTEGGIFPAIFGTILMVFLMTFIVTPLGVLAALYLREYATQGTFVALVRIAVNNLAGVPSIVFGLVGLGFFVYFLGGAIDSIFYPCTLNNAPTFGTGGVLWGALTLALLTIPVVIVATEEGLASVPREVRQGSLALGATKWETTLKVVIPAASPGILTGVILAIARAAGEVAPLMIVGMVKLADLPFDHHFPYMHLEAKFMHLGFHIYDLGFQSPNAEATRPLVYATALLLILLVTLMNVMAIALRNHLRSKYSTSAV
ncbi:MAG: phosphate ABC transporter, permease protein PstA [Planctomycetota bacterium]|nr:MAG: phosphate ABC transporter, permease protein PstA [Planctomycetota bacterium]